MANNGEIRQKSIKVKRTKRLLISIEIITFLLIIQKQIIRIQFITLILDGETKRVIVLSCKIFASGQIHFAN